RWSALRARWRAVSRFVVSVLMVSRLDPPALSSNASRSLRHAVFPTVLTSDAAQLCPLACSLTCQLKAIHSLHCKCLRETAGQNGARPEGVETGLRAGYREGMMSFRVVHAGTGYRYLLSSVATNDAAPGERGQRPPALSDYYQAKGTPAGRWIGSGVAGFASETAQAGQEISETQMAALYGEGLHPDADDRMRAGETLDDVKIGRAFAIYTGER